MADSYNSTTLTALFDTQDDAHEAVARLRDIGIADASVRVTGGEADVTRVDDDKGFWGSIGDFFFPEDDRETYAEGLRRGGYLVTVTGLSAEQYDQAVEILDDEGSVDVDERSATWRSEGWSGVGANTLSTGRATDRNLDALGNATTETYSDNAGTTAYSDNASTSAYSETASTSAYSDTAGKTASRSFSDDASATSRLADDDEVIPVIKEEFKVGKRDVNLGRVRVRSYVVEEPVSEQVNLREDRVHIERKSVDRPVSESDRMFTDKILEAEEHTEEAVISKQARVTEEIGLRRESEERAETVSDTIRHTEVEIEDERTEKLARNTESLTREDVVRR